MVALGSASGACPGSAHPHCCSVGFGTDFSLWWCRLAWVRFGRGCLLCPAPVRCVIVCHAISFADVWCAPRVTEGTGRRHSGSLLTWLGEKKLPQLKYVRPDVLICRSSNMSGLTFLICRSSNLSGLTFLICRSSNLSAPSWGEAPCRQHDKHQTPCRHPPAQRPLAVPPSTEASDGAGTSCLSVVSPPHSNRQPLHPTIHLPTTYHHKYPAATQVLTHPSTHSTACPPPLLVSPPPSPLAPRTHQQTSQQ